MQVVTLCGSARFEQDFIDANRELTLRGFIVISMSVLPSQAPNSAGKDWYTEQQKQILDLVHLEKITMSDAVLVVGSGYIGESTHREVMWAGLQAVPVVYQAHDIHPTEEEPLRFPYVYQTRWDAVVDRILDPI